MKLIHTLIIALCALPALAQELTEHPMMPSPLAVAPQLDSVVKREGANELTWSWKGETNAVVAFQISRRCASPTFNAGPALRHVAPAKCFLAHHKSNGIVFYQWKDEDTKFIPPDLMCFYTITVLTEKTTSKVSNEKAAAPE